jgi:LysM repeat protein
MNLLEDKLHTQKSWAFSTTNQETITGKCLTFLLLCLFNSSVFGEYIVRSGDTLSCIAEKELHDSSRWQEIAELNDISPPFRIKVGQKIMLPDSHLSADHMGEGYPFESDEYSDEFAWTWKSILFCISIILAIIGLILLVNTYGFVLACKICRIENTKKQCLLLAIFLILCQIIGGAPELSSQESSFKTYLFSVSIAAIIFFLSIQWILQCGWLKTTGVFFLSKITIGLVSLLFILFLAGIGIGAYWFFI